ncbi:alpha/beta hydrolase-fold protein [Kitasatospora sp. NPDC094015]|uniref:alpha/beta hydrolase n=1 Tax=Kitasatospora sp. NPDC094015 TaxID=3155205 RepID=UPI00332B6CD3
MARPLAGWNPLDWSLIHGPVPYALLVLGFGALCGLALSTGAHWWGRWLPCAVVLAALLTLLVVHAVDDWWKPFPDALPRTVTVWIGVALLGLCLAGFRMPPLTWGGRAGALLAAVLVLLMAANQVNRHYVQYPSLRAMLAPETQDLTTGTDARTVTVPPGRTLSEVWQPPAGLPARGTLSAVTIPGTRSGFTARDGYVYLPPAYQASPRPLLPVVVLMAGQPGGPTDWINSGGMPEVLDSFAAAHRGLAPVVVVADPLGSSLNNTLCMDSRIAMAQTYLSVDVPDWIHGHLQTGTGRTRWSVGGSSFGGTCALQLALNAPQVYGSFLDVSGQAEPTLGSHAQTVAKAFGGDEAAFDAVDPAHLMDRGRFPDTAGLFLVGAGDAEFGPQQEKMYAAATRAGVRATFETVPGGHDWGTFRAALVRYLPWVARQTGLTR